MERLRELYTKYYHSLPSERWLRKRSHRFKAKDVDDMTDIEMMCGSDREEAERELEEYFDTAVANGTLVWDESWGSWFYQDSECPTLILLKKWFDKKEI